MRAVRGEVDDGEVVAGQRGLLLRRPLRGDAVEQVHLDAGGLRAPRTPGRRLSLLRSLQSIERKSPTTWSTASCSGRCRTSSLAFFSPSVSSTCRSDGLNGVEVRPHVLDGGRVEPADSLAARSSSDRRTTVQYCGLVAWAAAAAIWSTARRLAFGVDVADLAVVAADRVAGAERVVDQDDVQACWPRRSPPFSQPTKRASSRPDQQAPAGCAGRAGSSAR